MSTAQQNNPSPFRGPGGVKQPTIGIASSDVTFVITSCGRKSLLYQTIQSFLDLNTYPIKECILNEDGGDSSMIAALMLNFQSYGFKLLYEYNTRIGLSASIDKLYREVKTPYIFHCEDDWLFEALPAPPSGGRGGDFIAQSKAVLEARPDIHQVWLRHISDHTHPISPEHKWVGDVAYRMVEKDFMGQWSGFSWNPGLRRTADYHRMFPNGFAEFGDEAECSKHANTFGYRAATLVQTVCRHTGNGHHTPNFKV